MPTTPTALSRPEQMWVTERVNAPGWGVFYGLVGVVFGLVGAISTVMADLTRPAYLISLLCCAIIAGGGVWIVVRSAGRIRPLQRMRKGRSADRTEEVRIVTVSDLRGLVLEDAAGRQTALHGPSPTPAPGAESIPVVLGETVTLRTWEPHNPQAAAIGRIDFPDGARAIGELREPL